METKDVISEGGRAQASAANATAGAVATVIEAAADPGRTASRGYKRLERKGRQVNRKLVSEVKTANGQVSKTTMDVLDGTLPERWLIEGLSVVKSQARRKDLVGTAAYSTISVLNGGLKAAVQSLNRLERATQPPARRTPQAAGSAKPRTAGSSRRRATTRARKSA